MAGTCPLVCSKLLLERSYVSTSPSVSFGEQEQLQHLSLILLDVASPEPQRELLNQKH